MNEMKHYYKVNDYECIRKITAGMLVDSGNHMKAWLIVQKEPIVCYASNEYIYECQLPDDLKGKFIKISPAEFENYVTKWDNEIEKAKKTPSPSGEAMVLKDDDIKKALDILSDLTKQIRR